MARWSYDDGARYTHDVPCVWTEGPGPAKAPSKTTTLPAKKHPDAKTATVLIVDDDLAAVDTFAKALRLEGYEVRTALSAEGGMRAVQASRPDAILVDFRMPLANGVEFLRRLRACEGYRDTPVAVVTGDYSLDDTPGTELDQLGARVAFKPLLVAELVDLTSRLLAGRVSIH
jgi:two-component system, OmpR family, response regulator